MTMKASEYFCCEACFEHAWLRGLAKEKSESQGRCFYCDTVSALTPIDAFRTGFTNLLGDYIPVEGANGGRDSYFPSVPMVEAVQRDWKVFSNRCLPERIEYFLPSLFNGDRDSPARDFQAPVVPFHRNAMSTAFGKWFQFWMIDPTAFSKRIDPDEPLDIDTIATLPNQQAQHLKYFVRTLSPAQQLWRARGDYAGTSEWDCQPLPRHQMGHNPKCPASRLNRSGEAVLYAAEAEKTAIAEIRPGRGFICTTCELTTKRPLEVLDLASPLAELNPFTHEHLSWHLDLQRVARNVSAHIAQPISRGEDSVVYNKTQYLAKLVRTMKLDGIRFSSSLDTPSGVNLALFDPSAVEYSNARLVTITNTQISYEIKQPSSLNK
ncbi:RES family NAD+ phosphorylase [Granulicella sp. dw_53]|uniref:RES family NAD+ phosphorylase n=1 Tax=Granulicella sp. dw_53 TaxID=2719792 RepID=UPI001BD6C9E5|nr:RES family NAD+ phosphorylase [Granulicella sp. dw_53]